MADEDAKIKTALTAHERLYAVHQNKMEKEPNRVFKKYKKPNGKSNIEIMDLASKPQ